MSVLHREKFCEEDKGAGGMSCLNLLFPFLLAALLFFWGQWMFNLMVCHIVGKNKAQAFICMKCVCLCVCESHFVTLTVQIGRRELPFLSSLMKLF